MEPPVDTAPAAWLHNLNPFAIRFSETFGIRWYGLSYLAGFFVGYLVILFLARRGRSQLLPAQVSDFIFTVALGTVIGGRLGYCLFYGPDLFLRFTSSPPFWGVLAINEGGMASHGGIVGVILACLFFARKHHISVLHCCDLCALTGPIGVCFGRIANFVNGELVGRLAPPGLSWAVKFPQDILVWPSHEPERLRFLEPVVNQVGVTSDQWQQWLGKLRLDGSAWDSVQNTLGSIVTAVQNHNQGVMTALRPLLSARYPSQLIEAGLEGILVGSLLFLIWRKPRKPGTITGCFFVIYSVVRILGEQFRMPDIQIGYQLFGLTRGQWLSIALLLIGLICLAYWSTRKTEKLGGWVKLGTVL
jgi:phosphatidylglycerol:prolipoprotein diacylglycerol transferase